MATVCVCPLPVSIWQYPFVQSQIHEATYFSAWCEITLQGTFCNPAGWDETPTWASSYHPTWVLEITDALVSQWEQIPAARILIFRLVEAVMAAESIPWFIYSTINHGWLAKDMGPETDMNKPIGATAHRWEVTMYKYFFTVLKLDFSGICTLLEYLFTWRLFTFTPYLNTNICTFYSLHSQNWLVTCFNLHRHTCRCFRSRRHFGWSKRTALWKQIN